MWDCRLSALWGASCPRQGSLLPPNPRFAFCTNLSSGPELSGPGQNGRKVMSRQLTVNTTLENLRKEAKGWLTALRQEDAQARRRFESAYPNGPAEPVLRDVQHALAREYEFENWTKLTQALEALESGGMPPQPARRPKPEIFQQAAADFVSAFDGDPGALARLNRHYGRSFT